MKQINKIGAACLVVLVMCMVLQSCASSKSRYGCPERISAEAEILP